MAEKKCKVGVVGGAGTWGRHYLRAFAEREDCEVILVDRAGERARQFADHHGVEKVLESLDDLLAGPVPDVVSAILPVSQTYGAVMACAEAGVRAISWGARIQPMALGELFPAVDPRAFAAVEDGVRVWVALLVKERGEGKNTVPGRCGLCFFVWGVCLWDWGG